MSQDRAKIEQESRDIAIMCGALVGLAVVALVQMLGLQTLDVPLTVSVYSFAVSIPALSATVLCMRDESHFGMRIASPFLSILTLFGLVTSLIGISGLFFHFATCAGLIFIVASLIALVIHLRYERALERLTHS